MHVPVTDLIGNPGATRSLDRTIAVEEVGDDPWGPAEGALRGDIVLDLQLDAVVEGVYVRGAVAWQLTVDCGRCLRPVELDREVVVGELFADPRRADPDDELDEGYEVIDAGAAIDLERMLHDTIVLDLPTSPRCGRADCEPPAVEGVVVMDADAARAARAAEPDPRWAALASLDLGDG